MAFQATWLEPSGDVWSPDYSEYVLLRLTEATLPEDFFSIFLEKYVNQTVPYLIVHETGKDNENPHFHCAFSRIGNMQTLRQFLIRLGLKGNQSYSLKVAKSDQMDAHFNYLCKGTGTGKEDGPDIRFRHERFTNAIVNQCHNRYWEKSKEISERKTKRKREEPASKEILAICRQKLEHGPKLALSEDEIIDITLEWYKNNKWSMNTFQMKAVVNYVSYCLNPDSNRVAMMKNALKFN